MFISLPWRTCGTTDCCPAPQSVIQGFSGGGLRFCISKKFSNAADAVVQESHFRSIESQKDTRHRIWQPWIQTSLWGQLSQLSEPGAKANNNNYGLVCWFEWVLNK